MGLSKFVFKQLLGWKIEGTFDPSIKKAIVVVAPHTSWHDFYIGALARSVLNTEINYLAKKELFVWPFGLYFKWMGGEPLDRTAGQKKTQAIAEVFKNKEEFRLALAPEGTRKKVEEWKTGFYYIARLANVPIYCVSFDYSKKTVSISPPYYTTNNLNYDLLKIKNFYVGKVGKVASYS